MSLWQLNPVQILVPDCIADEERETMVLGVEFQFQFQAGVKPIERDPLLVSEFILREGSKRKCNRLLVSRLVALWKKRVTHLQELTR